MLIRLSNGKSGKFSLKDISVAGFYKSLMSQLKKLGIETEIYASPNEIETPIPFAEDEQHAQYDHDQMGNLWQALILINNCFQKFRAGFVGKCSPEHMFWGASIWLLPDSRAGKRHFILVVCRTFHYV